MKTRYENADSKTFFVAELDEGMQLDDFTLGMVQNNAIEGLAPVSTMQINGLQYVKYNVSSKITLAEYLSIGVSKKGLLTALHNIVSTISALGPYMLETELLMFDPEVIFVNVGSFETAMLVDVTLDKHQQVDLRDFFKTIIFSACFAENEQTAYVSGLINYLNRSNHVFDSKDFDKNILALLNGSSAEKAPAMRESSPSQQSHSVSEGIPVQQQPVFSPVQPAANNIQQYAQVAPQQLNVPQASNTQSNTAAQISARRPNEADPIAARPQTNIHYTAEMPTKPAQEIGEANKKQKKGLFGGLGKKTEKKEKEPAPAREPKPEAKFGKKAPKFDIPGMDNSSIPAAPKAAAPRLSANTAPAPKQQVNMPAQQPANMSPQWQIPGVNKPNKPAQQQNAAPTQKPEFATITAPAAGKAVSGKVVSYGETTVLGGENLGATTVLDAEQSAASAMPCLIREKTNERIVINSVNFKIGKEKAFVDYFIGDNPTISRFHASITEKNGEYFIVDNNSLNHTYVNGVAIQSNVSYKLEAGMRVRLANEEFTFSLI